MHASKHTSNFTSTIYCTTKITLCQWHTNVSFPSNKSQIHKQLPLHQTSSLPSTCFSSKWTLSYRILHQNCVRLYFPPSPIYISIPPHLSDFATKLSRSISLISQNLHLFQTFLGPNVFLATLLSATSNCSPLSKVSHPYQTTGNISYFTD